MAIGHDAELNVKFVADALTVQWSLVYGITGSDSCVKHLVSHSLLIFYLLTTSSLPPVLLCLPLYAQTDCICWILSLQILG